MATKPVAKNAPKAVPAPEVAAEAPPPKKGSKKLIVIVLAVLLLAGGGGGGWYFFVKRGAQTTEQPKPAVIKPPVFVNLEPFTVNLQPETGADQFLQVVAVLRVADDKVAEGLKAYMPELRHRILLLLSGKKASDISTPDGREKLAGELRDQANRILAGNSPKPAPAAAAAGAAPQAAPKPEPADQPVQSVLFTSFIVQ